MLTPCHFRNFRFDMARLIWVDSPVMKTVFALVVLAGSLLSLGGCATPAYSTHERWQLITRNWAAEERQMQDDIDSLLLLRPMSRLSIWHIR